MTGATLQSVSTVPSASGELVEPGPVGPDEESREWVRCLHADGSVQEDAIVRLHALLLRAASFEVARRRPSLPHMRGNDLDDIANQAADDALVSVLRRLDDYRGDSRFTTWVYKFALLEGWTVFSSTGLKPDEELEQAELLATLQRAVADVLTPHQRTVLVALALNGVPIDVLAERLGKTRGALYKTLHDARRKLRNHLEEE